MIANYSDLTIKQFLQCKLISEFETDPLIRKCRLYAEITGMSLDEVESLPIYKLLEKLGELDSIESLPENAKVQMKFKAGGKTWRVKWRQQDLTTEQYIDAEHFCKQDPVQNIHNIIAALTNEVGLFGEKPYSGETHKERAELFVKELKIKTAYPIMLFFCRYYMILDDNILTFIVEKSQSQLQEVKSHFETSGVG